MALEISDDEQELLDMFRQVIIDLLREQEIELLRRLRAKFGGEKLYFGKLRGKPLPDRNTEIVRQHLNGASIRSLARAHRLSTTQVHRILREQSR
jgi:Mor family transcriptional regulator